MALAKRLSLLESGNEPGSLASPVQGEQVKAGPAFGGYSVEDAEFSQTGLMTQFNGVELDTGSCLAYAPEAFSGNASGLTATEMNPSLWAGPDGRFVPLKPYAVPCGNAYLNRAYCTGKDCSPENRAFRNWEGFAMYTTSSALEKCHKLSFSLGLPAITIPPFTLEAKVANIAVSITICIEDGPSNLDRYFGQSLTSFVISLGAGGTPLVVSKTRLRGFPFKTGPTAAGAETFPTITGGLPVSGNLRNERLPQEAVSDVSTLEFGTLGAVRKQNKTRKHLKPRYGTSLLMRQIRSRQNKDVEVLSEFHDSAVLAHHRKAAKTRLEGGDGAIELFSYDSRDTFPEVINNLANFGLAALWDDCQLYLQVRLELFEKIKVEPENRIKVFDLKAIFNLLLDSLECNGELGKADRERAKEILEGICVGGDPSKPETFGIPTPAEEILYLNQPIQNQNRNIWKDRSPKGNDLVLNGPDTSIGIKPLDCCAGNVQCYLDLFGRSSTGQTEYQNTNFRLNMTSGKEAFFVASFAEVKSRQFIFDFGQYATFGFGVLFTNQDIEAYGPGDVKASSSGSRLEAGKDYLFRVQWVPGLHIRIILNNVEEIAKVPFPDTFVEEDISGKYFTVLGQSKEAGKAERRLNGRLSELALFEGIMFEEDAKEYGDLLMKKWFFDPAQRDLACAARCQFGN